MRTSGMLGNTSFSPKQNYYNDLRRNPSLRHLGMALCLILTAGCTSEALQAKRQDSGNSDDRPSLVIPVEVVPPLRGNVSSYFETTTRVQAERSVDVSAEAIGTCAEVLVEEGDEVAQGDVLVQLDKEQAEAALRQIEVLVRQNESTYKLALKQSKDGHGARVETDNAYFAYEKSLADLEMQRVQLANLTIRAPIGGIITGRHVQIGKFVSPGDHVFSIVDPDSFILAINPPEKELSRLHVGQRAEVRIDALRGREFSATIRRINPAINPLSGTIKVVLDFDEADRRQLPDSAFARVKLVMDTRKNVLLVPKEAVLEESGRKFLFVVDQSDDQQTARRIEVGTGLEDSRNVQIFRGLNDDHLVVVNGQHTLKTGTLIKVTNIADELRSNNGIDPDDALAAAKKRRESGETENASRAQSRNRH